MLWKCEESGPRDWAESNLVSICCQLLQELKSRMLDGYLRDYFLRYNNISNRLAYVTVTDSWVKDRDKTIEIIEFHSNEANFIEWLTVKTFENKRIAEEQAPTRDREFLQSFTFIVYHKKQTSSNGHELLW